MDYIKYGASYKSTVTMAANGSDVIVSPAANTRGMVVWTAEFATMNNGNASVSQMAGLVAHTAAPTAITSGDLIAAVSSGAVDASFSRWQGKLSRPVFIPPGKGLYWFSGVAEAGSIRSVLYDLL